MREAGLLPRMPGWARMAAGVVLVVGAAGSGLWRRYPATRITDGLIRRIVVVTITVLPTTHVLLGVSWDPFVHGYARAGPVRSPF